MTAQAHAQAQAHPGHLPEPALPALPAAPPAVSNPAVTPLPPSLTPTQTLEAVTPLLPARLATQFAALLQVLPNPSATIISQVIHHLLLASPPPPSKKRALPDHDKDDAASLLPAADASPAPKRPKLAPTAGFNLAPPPSTDILVAIPDLSVSSPLRKKLTLLLTRDALYLAPSRTDPPVFHLAYAQIAKAVLVDAPEKTKRQPMLLVFGNPSTTTAVAGSAYGELEPVTLAVAIPEAIVSAVPESMRRGHVGSNLSFAAIFAHLTSHALGIAPTASNSPAVFASAKRSPMGKRTNHPYLTCYHKGKDGHLWLLTDGLVYGLKKPFLWIPLTNVAAIQLVANGRNKVDVHVHTTTGSDRVGMVVKFDMVEADEAAGVKAYVDKVKRKFASVEGGAKGAAGDDQGKSKPRDVSGVPFLAMDWGEDEDEEDGSAPEDESDHSDSDESDGSGGDDQDDSGSDQDDMGEEGKAAIGSSRRVTRSGRAFVSEAASPTSNEAADEQDHEDDEMDELASDVDI
ncbi:hypothetical protein BCR44DRAFT_46818 [Catenaria anguillulae PL171]|uniref:Histone chaperone RTT106/FACT complex subunit SPT16-like middle domain-containing protein n=1 Tax=Catenaria anguillulae PL171 TaxID=765915 RepID=A0A1Y2HWP6_9FUNG|nr:hypothetical protein BCR44DRAFT_46818 [Catenaria anguillulae PL171]